MQVAETCQLALQRIQHMKQQQAAAAAAATSTDESPYMSVDPTPALPASTPISELREILLDESRRMFDRYSALFALRNKGGPEVVQVGIMAACCAWQLSAAGDVCAVAL
jgi:deoxyhypusine monooxygenase